MEATLTPRAITPPDLQNHNSENSRDFRIEINRLDSFDGWLFDHPNPRNLARAGFYYTGRSDHVRCFACGIEISHWEVEDIIEEEHKKWSPRCRFLNNLACGNVPIGVDPATVPPFVPSMDVCGRFRFNGAPLSLPREAVTGEANNDNGNVRTSGAKGEENINNTDEQVVPSLKVTVASQTETLLPFTATEHLGHMGMVVPRKPDQPSFVTYASRLQSFTDWPLGLEQTKEILAEAGFFYTNRGDRTVCYHCGGGLFNWRPGDDVWQLHAKFFPNCQHVRVVKGQQYIDRATGNRPSPPSDEELAAFTELPFCLLNKNASVLPGKTPPPQPSAPVTTSPSNEFSTCKVCYDAELGTVFVPCGHVAACLACAASGLSECVICRRKIQIILRVYFA